MKLERLRLEAVVSMLETPLEIQRCPLIYEVAATVAQRAGWRKPGTQQNEPIERHPSPTAVFSMSSVGL